MTTPIHLTAGVYDGTHYGVAVLQRTPGSNAYTTLLLDLSYTDQIQGVALAPDASKLVVAYRPLSGALIKAYVASGGTFVEAPGAISKTGIETTLISAPVFAPDGANLVVSTYASAPHVRAYAVGASNYSARSDAFDVAASSNSGPYLDSLWFSRSGEFFAFPSNDGTHAANLYRYSDNSFHRLPDLIGIGIGQVNDLRLNRDGSRVLGNGKLYALDANGNATLLQTVATGGSRSASFIGPNDEYLAWIASSVDGLTLFKLVGGSYVQVGGTLANCQYVAGSPDDLTFVATSSDGNVYHCLATDSGPVQDVAIPVLSGLSPGSMRQLGAAWVPPPPPPFWTGFIGCEEAS